MMNNEREDIQSLSGTSDDGVEEEAPAELVVKETSAVKRSKALVYLALVFAAVTVGCTIFFVLRAGEQSDFETQFDVYSTTLLEAANANAKNSFGKLHELSDALTSFTQGNDSSEWPFVTLPNFDIRSKSKLEKVTGSENTIFAPIVPSVLKKQWQQYAIDHQEWIKDDLFYRERTDVDPGLLPRKIYPFFEEDDSIADFTLPLWQAGPVPKNSSLLMVDLYTHPSIRRLVDEVLEVQHVMLSEVVDRGFLPINVDTLDGKERRSEFPRSYAVQPVFEDFVPNSEIVAFVIGVVPWDSFFVDSLPLLTSLEVKVEDKCGSQFSLLVNGPNVEFLGETFQHNNRERSFSDEFAEFARYDGTSSSNAYLEECTYTVTIYPTSAFAEAYKTNLPFSYALVAVAVFVFTACVFLLYDLMVERRQNRVMDTAQRTNAIMDSLFPREIKERMMEEAKATGSNDSTSLEKHAPKTRIQSFLAGNNEATGNTGKPMADLYPDTSIIFADLVGFTAWSSAREPSQVFELLETVFGAFDKKAKQHRIFKVETVGDCYVAVCGLPRPRKNHAVAMARFANDCLTTFLHLTNQLEVTLGPDTADLKLRVGIHSGPVTAGVLRGERARFQLFGDTMNTASRMESNGKPNKIQLSQETADLLTATGKGHWVSAREDKVYAKGKGELSTFWLNVIEDDAKSSTMSRSSYATSEFSTDDETPLPAIQCNKTRRLIEWNCDVLLKLLKQIAERRQLTGIKPDSPADIASQEAEQVTNGHTILDEVEDTIELPTYCQIDVDKMNLQELKMDEAVQTQLSEFIGTLAAMYHDNPFHNFEHASHVTMSATKLLSRIVTPDLSDANASCLHDHTYGITSDPLTQFACVFSSLIHDVDHQGVPNMTLVKEGSTLAAAYKNQSVAEQNSVEIAWSLFMRPDFVDLRRAIYITKDECKRFRQLVVNAVLATDVMDKELNKARKDRWNVAFLSDDTNGKQHDINRKATIVIEHLIQASDVSHTMQHWHVYRKWNQRLFEEMHEAFRNGRGVDPSENWYEGELGFFDFYVIPLAKKLGDCGVFGVSSDEYLNYAKQNRKEWAAKGRQIVAEMMESMSSVSNS